MEFKKLRKLKKGDKVAILSPSFAAPGMWPHIHELGLTRLREIFELESVEFPATRKLSATKEERSADLIAAFEDNEIKAVITTLGGDDQVTYIKNLPSAPFANNPKPFFGYSDNTHFMNFLWQNGVPSYYGGCLFTQFARQGRMDDYTIEYLRKALFEDGEFEIFASKNFNDIDLDWEDISNLTKERVYEPNEGWIWDGGVDVEGTTWGGCLESIDEILRHGGSIPTPKDFGDIILIIETSEGVPTADYVWRVCRALGERGILERVKAVLVARPKSWYTDKQLNAEQKKQYKEEQRETILKTIREYNKTIPVIQNMDFGHTDPQIPFPYGKKVRIDSINKRVFVEF